MYYDWKNSDVLVNDIFFNMKKHFFLVWTQNPIKFTFANSTSSFDLKKNDL